MDWVGWGRVMKNEIWFFYRWWIAVLAIAAWENWGQSPISQYPFTSSPPRFREIPSTRHTTGIYLILSILSLASYAKIGAAPNYALEPLAAAALWGCETLGRLLDRLEGEARILTPLRRRANAVECGGLPPLTRGELAPRQDAVIPTPSDKQACPAPAEASLCTPHMQRWSLRVGVWAVALLLLAHAGHLWILSRSFAWTPAPSTMDRAAAREILMAARETPGSAIFSEEPIFTLLAGKPVMLQPFIMAQLAREGRWDDAPLRKMLTERQFGCLIVTEDLARGGPDARYERYTAGFASALRGSYRPAGRITLPTLGRAYTLWLPSPTRAVGPARESR